MSNRNVAYILVAMMALAVVPTSAEAATGTDVIVEKLNVDNGIVGHLAWVNLTLRNLGGTAMSGPFTVFVGHDGVQNDNCLDNGTVSPNQQDVVKPCYLQVPTGASIGPGATYPLSMRWNVTSAIAHQANGQVTIATLIEPGPCFDQNNCRGTSTSGITSGNANANPDDVTSNNRMDFSAFARIPGVRAYPLRDAPPVDGGGNVNSAWPGDKFVATDKCDNPSPHETACVVLPGHSVFSRYHVVNTGNDADTFTPIWNNSGDQTMKDRGFEVKFSPKSKFLAKGESTEFVAQVFVPEDAPAGMSWNIGTTPNLTAVWASATDPNVNSASIIDCTPEFDTANECVAATLLPFVVGVKHGLNLTTNLKDNFTHVTALHDTDLGLVLKNTGNAVDTYNVTFDRDHSTINDSWLGLQALPPLTKVDVGASVNVAVRVNAPLNATRGYYTASYLVQSASLTDSTLPQRVSFTLQLDQIYGLSAQLDTSLQLVLPGESTSFGMSVTNTGNGPENLTIALANVPSGWTAALSDTALSVGPYGTPDATKHFFLNASAPANTPAGRAADFFVNVTSNDPQDRPADRPKATPMEAKMRVLQGPNVEITSGVTTQFINPGNTTTYPIHLRNVGNEAAKFLLHAEHSDTLWTANVTPNNVTLDPLNSGVGIAEADVMVTLTAPPLGQVGDLDRLTLTIAPTTSEGKTKQLVLEGRISGPDLVAQRIDLNTTTPYSGDPLGVTVRVANTGNRLPETAVAVGIVALNPDGSTTPIANVTIPAADLRPNSVRDIPVTWDTTGISGSVVLQATVDPASAVPEIDETNNVASKAVTLRTFGIVLSAVTGLEGHPGEKLSYNAPPNVFQAQYTGNQPSEPVQIVFVSEHGWIAPDKTTRNLDLPRGAIVPIPVDVEIPALPGASSDRITMKVIPSYRTTAIVTVSATTSVLDEEKPVLGAVTVQPATTTLGQNVTLRVAITDATGLASVRANIITPTQDIASYLLALGPDGTYSTTQAFTSAGTYSVMIVAIDASPHANTLDTHQVVATFTVTPGSVPVIALAPGQLTTIHTGSLVKLSITDPLGIGKANYTYKSVVYDLGRNYTIDTSAFVAGDNEVVVTAENLYHVPQTARFTFKVDNAQPNIRGVTITPSTPKAGQSTTVHVETDAKVASVKVLVKKGDTVVQPLDAQKKGTGVFEVTFTPDIGDYTVEVSAQDVSGNPSKVNTVSFSAKPDSPFHVPGVELALLVCGLAGLALVVRRKR